MSINTENASVVGGRGQATTDRPGGAIEPWFGVLVSSLVPLLGGLVVPSPWSRALHVLGAILCLTGLAMLVRHEMAVRRNQDVTDR